jgi:cell division protein FtsB
VARRRTVKKKTGKRSFLSLFLFLLLLLTGAVAGFLFHLNIELRRDIIVLRKEITDLRKNKPGFKDEVKSLKIKNKKLDAEIAELRIQALIKNSDSPQ